MRPLQEGTQYSHYLEWICTSNWTSESSLGENLERKSYPPWKRIQVLFTKFSTRELSRMVQRKNFNSWYLSKISLLILQDGFQPKTYRIQVSSSENLELTLERKMINHFSLFSGGGSVNLGIKWRHHLYPQHVKRIV